MSFLESKFGFYISRNPKEKYLPAFQEEIHVEILKQCTGILHIGAHIGQESNLYSQMGKPVIFIEALPTVHSALLANIANQENQTAYNLLLGDRAQTVPFYIASNNSESSSVLPFASQEVFENVTTTEIVTLEMKRLDEVFDTSDLAIFNHWVIDVQGAEKLVLLGAGKLLANCKSLVIEYSTYEFYKNQILYPDLQAFLSSQGFYNIFNPRNLVHSNMLFVRSG